MIFFKLVIAVKPGKNVELFNSSRLTADAIKFINSLSGASMITTGGQVKIKIEQTELSGKSFIVMASIPGEISSSNQKNIFIIFEDMFNKILTAKVLAEDYQISTLNIANQEKMFEVSRNYATLNQMLLDKAGFKDDLPEEFTCQLSNQVMDEPVTLPSGVVVELAVIMIAYSRNPLDPYTNSPFDPELLEVNEDIKNKIEDFMVLQVLAKEQVKQINAGLDSYKKQIEDTSKVGNPYGIDSQRYNIGGSFCTVLKMLSMRKASGVIEQYKEEHRVFSLNFPDKSKTETAVKDLFHAVRNKNRDKVDLIMNAYPLGVRQYLFDFANQFNFFSKLELKFNPQIYPQPLDQPHLDERCGYTKA
jgi:hypothetical protein